MGSFFVAIGIGIAAGAVMGLFLICVGAFLGATVRASWLELVPLWLAVAAPVLSALAAAVAAASVLHWRKVSSRGAVHVGVLGLALVVLVTAQLFHFADLAALLRTAGSGALLSASAWRNAFAFPALTLPDIAQAPGPAAVALLWGVERAGVAMLVELALVLALARWMTGRALAVPLCLACRAWCVRQRGFVERAAGAAVPELVRQRVAARDWRFVRDLGPARGGAGLRFDLCRCPRCNRNNAVSVMWKRRLWRDRCLIGNVRLGSDDMRMLLDLVEAKAKPEARAA